MIDNFAVTDLHIHIQPWDQLSDTAGAAMAKTRPADESADIARYIADPGAFVSALDDWGIDRAALINYVAPEVIGFDASVNDWVAEYCTEHRDRLLPVGSVSPRHVSGAAAAYKEAERLCSTLELSMLKLHPAHQILYPDAYRRDSRGHHGHPPDDRPYGDALVALYEACIDHDTPLMIHTGTSVFPGALNTGTDPLLVDTVASDFPKLRIVMAHAGRPLWGEAAQFTARRHANVMLDLSGIPPRALPKYVPGLPSLWKKCLWGTDWPGPGVPAGAMRRNVSDFIRTAREMGLDDEAIGAVLDGNSRQLIS